MGMPNLEQHASRRECSRIRNMEILRTINKWHTKYTHAHTRWSISSRSPSSQKQEFDVSIYKTIRFFFISIPIILTIDYTDIHLTNTT
jgi:hypothetical protein